MTVSLASQTGAYSLAGRVACITGAGRGIGAAAARQLARSGARVLLMSRTARDLEAVVQEIAAEGGDAVALPCDVTDVEQVRQRIGDLSRLDIFVNNAGTNVPAKFVEVSDEDLDRMIGLNVRAAFLVAQAAVRKMLAMPAEQRMAGGASIVHVTSQMGRVGAAGRTVYCMTKHAIEGLSKAMAVELAPQGIRVNCVAPTFLDTALTAPFFAKDPGFKEWVLSRIPLGRLGQVEEVARIIEFLSSPVASLITGESIAADGGWTAQ